ncbi:DNA-binding protein [Lysobacteraceae bacterium NML93-0399]|nr:DNA-binding protein [Xanthomonadaceae bacterium NML93-0399]
MKYMTPREAAAYLSLSHHTLAKWRCVGGGPEFLKWGERMVRYSLADLDTWAAARTLANTAQNIALAA